MYPGLPEPPPPGTAMLPPGTFAGVTVFITGGGTGLGRVMAAEFAPCGAAVGIASRDAAHRERGVAEVRSAGGRAVDVPCDVRDPEAVRAAFDTVEDALGPVTVLVDNAAATFPTAAADLSPNGWRAVTDISASSCRRAGNGRALLAASLRAKSCRSGVLAARPAPGICCARRAPCIADPAAIA